MARLEKANSDGEIAAQLLARRKGALRPIDEMLLHSPQVAEGWNLLLGAIRERLSLAADLRELVILRIAVLNDAEYEWASHEHVARSAGLGDDLLVAIREPHAAELDVFSPVQRAVIAYADRMTREIEVPLEQFESLHQWFSAVELVELTVTIAAYNMVSRFAVALDVTAP